MVPLSVEMNKDSRFVMDYRLGATFYDGKCRFLLWAPNAGGSRPWSDKAGGRERLEHCKLAVAAPVVEALLVYGETMEGYIPEDRTRSVHGVDPETVVSLKVERAGEEYWAVWGRKRA